MASKMDITIDQFRIAVSAPGFKLSATMIVRGEVAGKAEPW